MLPAHIPPSQPVHWSKDFVEHLRTVHLSLIAVSLAIIIIILSATPYNPTLAIRELHQIVELKKVWSATWIREHGNHELVALPDAMSTPEPKSMVSLKPTSKALIALARRRDFKSPVPANEILLLLPNVNHIEIPELEPVDVAIFPSSLSEFEGWWDHLSRPLEMYFPVGVIGRSGVLPSSSPFFSYPALQQPLDSTELFPNVTKFQLLLIPITHSGRVEAEYFVPFAATAKRPYFAFYFSITSADRVRLDQQNIATFLGNWKPGDFRESFFDLWKAANGFDSLEIEDIEKILDAEAAKGAEVLEVLGFKIPVDQLTIWGTVILIGVQVYLLLFLKQLSGKLGPDDTGWDVPWMGMDQTRFAQALLFLTIVLLPCTAIAILGGRGTLHLTNDYHHKTAFWHFISPPWRWSPPILAKIALLLLTLAGSILLAVLSWKYRPRIRRGFLISSQPDSAAPSD